MNLVVITALDLLIFAIGYCIGHRVGKLDAVSGAALALADDYEKELDKLGYFDNKPSGSEWKDK